MNTRESLIDILEAKEQESKQMLATLQSEDKQVWEYYLSRRLEVAKILAHQSEPISSGGTFVFGMIYESDELYNLIPRKQKTGFLWIPYYTRIGSSEIHKKVMKDFEGFIRSININAMIYLNRPESCGGGF